MLGLGWALALKTRNELNLSQINREEHFIDGITGFEAPSPVAMIEPTGSWGARVNTRPEMNWILETTVAFQILKRGSTTPIDSARFIVQVQCSE